MIKTARGLSMGNADISGETGDPRLMVLRAKINDEAYLEGAIQRIALILSNELMNIPHGGLGYERRRKKQR